MFEDDPELLLLLPLLGEALEEELLCLVAALDCPELLWLGAFTLVDCLETGLEEDAVDEDFSDLELDGE